MTTSFSAKTVKILVHLTGDGRAAVGVLLSEWRGPHRLDRRLASARPVLRGDARPPRGVDPAVWYAWLRLGEILEEQGAQGTAER